MADKSQFDVHTFFLSHLEHSRGVVLRAPDDPKAVASQVREKLTSEVASRSKRGEKCLAIILPPAMQAETVSQVFDMLAEVIGPQGRFIVRSGALVLAAHYAGRDRRALQRKFRNEGKKMEGDVFSASDSHLATVCGCYQP